MIDSENVGIFSTKTFLSKRTAYVEESGVEPIMKHMLDLDESDVRRLMSSFPEVAQDISRICEGLSGDMLLAVFRFGALSCPTKAMSVHGIRFSNTFNTSCQPNIRLHFDRTPVPRIIVKAGRKILPGEELVFAEHYSFACMTTIERREAMTEALRHPQLCTCLLCAQSAAERLASDMRRCLMRHLWFMVKGRDLPNVRPKVTSFKKDKFGSPQWRLRWHILDKLAEAEGVSWMIEDLEKIDRRGVTGPVVLRQVLVEW
jgi:hypothetical protein